MLEFLMPVFSAVPENLSILIEIGIMLIVAGAFAFLLRLIRQPLIPAYILAGIVLGPLFLGLIRNTNLILSLSEIGVAFLLFFAGLELNLKKLKEVGLVSSISGIIQIAALFALGFFIALLIGLQRVEALYIGLVLAFSSTMIVVKLLSDKNQLNTLHGRIILGVLIVQDIVAIIALTLLTTDFTLLSVAIAIAKAGIFALTAVILAKIANPIFKISAKTPELIVLIAIAFLFLFSIASQLFGLSLVIGAFFSGVALANSKFKTEIQGRIAPLRDFFSVIFFVSLGMQLVVVQRGLITLFFILMGLTVIIKPLILMASIKLGGYKRRTSFLSGISLAQTSEFSLIILALGLSLAGSGKGISQGLFSVLVLLTIVTMSMTSYVVKYDNRLFNLLGKLNLFGKGELEKDRYEYLPNKKKKIVIIGCHRMGSLFLDYFADMKKNILVIDYDPEIIQSLINKKVSCLYGDFANKEVMEKANLEGAEVVFSTIPEFEDNLLLIKKAKEINPKIIVLVTAERISEAEELYENGADYVILPKVISGKMSFELVKKFRKNKQELKKIKKSSRDYLKRIHHLLYGE